MRVIEAIEKRRAYRSLKQGEITDEMISDLARQAGLAPSCFNKQPWRFVFVRDRGQLERIFEALTGGNRWAHDASMIIAVFSQPDLDCMIKERHYFLLDTGMALGFLLLRATELELVAHPIAGFDEEKVKEILEIPAAMQLITLVIVGKKAESLKPSLNEKQAAIESSRPARLELNKIAFMDRYSPDHD
jgi:nitroreductase